MCGEMSEEDYSLGAQIDGIAMKCSLKRRIIEGLRLLYCDIKSARWAIMLVVAYFVFLKKVLRSLCPMVLLTGFPCPGCGLTRAGFKVLGFDFAGAWGIHPFIFAIILLILVFAAERYVYKSREMNASKWCAIVIIAGMIAFYGWRMYTQFPDVPPMTYYRRNLMAFLFGRLK